MYRKESVQKTGSAIPSHRAASRLASAINRPPTIAVILSRCAAARLVSGRNPECFLGATPKRSLSVFLPLATSTDKRVCPCHPDAEFLRSAAKDLAGGQIGAVGLGANFISAGQMLHFVQHDKRCRGYFIRSRSAASQLASAMKRLPNLLLIAAIVLTVTTAGCRYWAGPLPLGATNDTRLADNPTSRTWAEPMDVPGVPNLHKVSDDLFRGAQPTAEGIGQLEKLGVKTVVNLRDDYDDRKEMRDATIAYERIPMTAWYVQDDDIVQFLRTVTDERNTPVFVHCRRGADRTGLGVAIYRVAVQGWTKDEAIAEMTRGGFAFYSGWQNLVRYLRDLDVDRLKHEAGLTSESVRHAD